MEVSVSGFQAFCEANTLENVAHYCALLASDLSVAYDQLSDLLMNEHCTIYCENDELAELYGFYDETDMIEEIRDIEILSGYPFSEINERLHEKAKGIEGGFYGGGGLIFIDLPALRAEFGITGE
ncbi:MAG: hypothetical protein ACRC47_16860 [Shewanella sp.]